MSTELPAHTSEKLNRLKDLRVSAGAASSLGLALLYYSEFVQTSSMHQGELMLSTMEADERYLAAVGMASEAGEVLDQFKKAIYHKGERGQFFAADREVAIEKELGDVLWYYVLMLCRSGKTLDEIMFSNMDKLIQREIDKQPAMTEERGPGLGATF